MNSDFLVSICIPAYNHPSFLEKCLQSIISQTHSNFEVIITDDSASNHLEIVANKFNDRRIKYYKNLVPLGSPKNWNYCISLASGDLIKILHHDDWFFSDSSLQQYVDIFCMYPSTEFAFSQCYNVSSTKTSLHATSATFISKVSRNPLLLLFGNVIGAPSTIIFTKKVAQEFKFNELSSWYVDVIFYIDLLLAEINVKYITEPLVNITTESQFQVTNSLSGLKKMKEAIFIHDMYKSAYSNFKLLCFLQFLDIFTRYKLKNIKELELIDMRPVIKYAYMFSKFKIDYRIYALLRRVYLRFCV